MDTEVGNEILRVIGGNAVQAIEQMREQQQQHRQALELELEQARYGAQLAARRYEAVDPAHRLVASELEHRWNGSMERVVALEIRLQCEASEAKPEVIPDKELLLSLAQDLPAVWNSSAADMRLKQRIVQILIREIIVEVDQEKREIVLLIHWIGGRPSEPGQKTPAWRQWTQYIHRSPGCYSSDDRPVHRRADCHHPQSHGNENGCRKNLESTAHAGVPI